MQIICWIRRFVGLQDTLRDLPASNVLGCLNVFRIRLSWISVTFILYIPIKIQRNTEHWHMHTDLVTRQSVRIFLTNTEFDGPNYTDYLTSMLFALHASILCITFSLEPRKECNLQPKAIVTTSLHDVHPPDRIINARRNFTSKTYEKSFFPKTYNVCI